MLRSFLGTNERPYNFVSNIEIDKTHSGFLLTFSSSEAMHDMERRLRSYDRIYRDCRDKPAPFTFNLEKTETDTKIRFSGDLKLALDKLRELSCLSSKQYEKLEKNLNLSIDVISKPALMG